VASYAGAQRATVLAIAKGQLVVVIIRFGADLEDCHVPAVAINPVFPAGRYADCTNPASDTDISYTVDVVGIGNGFMLEDGIGGNLTELSREAYSWKELVPYDRQPQATCFF
jgi:hypothetical protein